MFIRTNTSLKCQRQFEYDRCSTRRFLISQAERDEGYWDTTGGASAVQAVAVERVEALKRANGIIPILGHPGNAMMFTGTMVHGSEENLSPLPLQRLFRLCARR